MIATGAADPRQQYSDSPVDTDRFSGTEAQLLSFTRMPKSR